MSAVNMVRQDGLDVDRSVWTPGQLAIIRAAARDPVVERIFVNAAIKKALCRDATGDRSWLNKVRPYYGHNYHFHVRIACPDGGEACQEQDPVPPGDGCDASLNWWFRDADPASAAQSERQAETADDHGRSAAGMPPGACRQMSARSELVENLALISRALGLTLPEARSVRAAANLRRRGTGMRSASNRGRKEGRQG